MDILANHSQPIADKCDSILLTASDNSFMNGSMYVDLAGLACPCGDGQKRQCIVRPIS